MKELQNKVENLLWLPRKVQLPAAANIAPHMSATSKWRVALALRQKGQKKGKRPKDKPVAFGKKKMEKMGNKKIDNTSARIIKVHRL